MIKKTKTAFVILAFAAVLAGCKKSETLKSDSQITATGNSTLSGGDGKWDLLGFGLDVTKDLFAESSVSDVTIFDMIKFENDFKDRIDAKINVTTSTSGSEQYYSGASALDYAVDINNKRSFDINGNATIAGAKKATGTEPSPDLNFTGSFVRNSSDQKTTTYSSKYSYATYEVEQKVKRIRFTGDVTMDLLKEYLAPEFVSNIANWSAADLVARYGTHVMLDFSIGGRLRFNYSGIVKNESDTQKTTSYVKTGFGLNMLKLLGVNITVDKTKEEMTKVSTETRNKDYTGKFYGGTNSGKSMAIDKDGNTTENLNIASWQQSITEKNARLVDVGRAVFLYDFITDPTKKALVKAEVEKHIKDSQIQQLGEVAVFEFFHQSTGGHVFTTKVNEYPYAQNGWSNFGVKFYTFNTQKFGTVPIHSYVHSGQNQHVLTSNRAGYPYEQNGFTYAGIQFYAYPNQVAGTVPVYSFYHAQSHKHTYTAYPNEYAYAQNGWNSEGVAFYAYSLD